MGHKYGNNNIKMTVLYGQGKSLPLAKKLISNLDIVQNENTCSELATCKWLPAFSLFSHNVFMTPVSTRVIKTGGWPALVAKSKPFPQQAHVFTCMVYPVQVF